MKFQGDIIIDDKCVNEFECKYKDKFFMYTDDIYGVSSSSMFGHINYINLFSDGTIHINCDNFYYSYIDNFNIAVYNKDCGGIVIKRKDLNNDDIYKLKIISKSEYSKELNKFIDFMKKEMSYEFKTINDR